MWFKIYKNVEQELLEKRKIYEALTKQENINLPSFVLFSGLRGAKDVNSHFRGA